jgi:methyl-accepting chemotaxis protein
MERSIVEFVRPVASGRAARILLPALAVMALGALFLRVSAGASFAYSGILLSSVVLAAALVAILLESHGNRIGLEKMSKNLADAMEGLAESTEQQSQTVYRQAAALQETQVTAQEIKQTSQVAAQKAEDLLKLAEHAEQIGKTGERSVGQSMEGLLEIRARVEEITQKVGELTEKTRQIESITDTVKDLADQSNMLALNAAIEAARSGEHGKGFALVAKEIRSLADQSIQATARVRDILDNISSAVAKTVKIAETGYQRIDGGLENVKNSGDNLRALAGLVQEHSAAAKQIAAAVGQQNAGIVQIFSAVTDQNHMMDETVKRLELAANSVQAFEKVHRSMSEMAKRHQV